ncbi:MAG: hypothetical protein DRQ08_06210 [Candidatus Latescibacterota bacterium]|nr:MAG: hypothetical protein DRQ08_06210 [Candidatus Latescibacterota bacterium]
MIDSDTIFGFWPRWRADVSLEVLLKVMEEHGVDRFLSLSTTGIFYDYEEGNEETLRAAERNPELVPVATVDPRKYSGGKGLVRKLSEEGFKALRFFPDLQAWPFTYEPFLELLREAEEVGMPVMTSAPGLGRITELARATDGHGVPVVVTGVNYNQFSEAIAVMRSRDNFYITTSLLDTPDAYEAFVREVGAGRLMFGSYSPLHYFSSSFLALEKAELGDEDRRLILRENAERLLWGR